MSKMKFDEFKEAVVSKIREFLPETFANADVRLNVVTKNNDLQLTGLVINAGNSNVAPTIYLESFFDAYEKGEDINEILRKIADTRVTHEFGDNFEVGEITDFERCKGKIVPRLIGKKWNNELLRTRPYKEAADLAITYCIMLGEDDNGTMSVPITNDLMISWGVTVDDLHELAITNMEDITPFEFALMSSVIGHMLLDEFPQDMTEEEKEQALSDFGFMDEAMFVLTNRQKMYGAAALLSKSTMTDIIKKIGKDFFILPSSVHEVLVVPATPDMEALMLKNMVCEVNETQVSPEDRLSDSVYIYTEKGGLQLAK